MRVGIFGGSFDPPHIGHLLVAQDAADELALDRLLVIPAAQQPLKGGWQTAPHHRLAMVRAAFEGIPRVEVDPIEIERGGLSFMVETVESIRQRVPLATLHLLVGDDVVPTLPRWRDVDRLLSMVQLVVLHRADRQALSPAAAASETSGAVGAARRITTRRLDLSSTEIRTRVQDGRSIRGFVPDAVAAYIATTGLYLQNSRELSAAEGHTRA
jgi:nicotinate-nucleotide adenylyltransferase